MKSKAIARAAVWLVGGLLLVGTTGVATTTIEACGESGACSSLRDQEWANLLTWSACDPSKEPSDQCMIVAGNPRDCTGVLSCTALAINPRFRNEAEKAVLTAGQQSQGCYLCAQPDCTQGGLTLCDPINRRCIVYTSITLLPTADGGTTPIVVVGEDSGAPPNPVVDSGQPVVDSAAE